MKVIESLLTKNPCYKAGKTISVKGLSLLAVGCPQPSAKVFVNNWNRETYERACVHAFIDAGDYQVYQTLPWNYKGKHASSELNNTNIAVSLCEPVGIKYRKDGKIVVIKVDSVKESVRRTYRSAVELFAQLCLKYNLNPETDVVFPRNGIENPEHLWSGVGLSYTLDTFKADLKDEMEKIDPSIIVKEAEATPVAEIPVKEADAVVKEIEIKSVFEVPANKRVRVDVINLRIRIGPGTEYKPIGRYTGVGVFEIAEIQNGTGSSKGWAKLQNGLGWVSLDYANLIE